VLGVVCVILGAASGFKDWVFIEDVGGRIALGIFGFFLVITGLVITVRNSGSEPNGRAYGITIESPGDRDKVDVVTVRGRIRRRLPKGYTLMVLRIYPRTRNGVYPLKEVSFEPDGKRWSAFDCNIGGSSGDERIIGAYLIGPSARALITYFKEAERTHGEALEQARALLPPGTKLSLPSTFVFLPLIFERPADMIRGDEVRVFRR
jgi:hypothetical protein